MLTDADIAHRIAGFPDWHYNFKLRGYETNPSGGNLADARVAYFLDPVVGHYGGDLRAKRVLDLGCNAGYFSLKAIEAGCDHVLGIDGRQMHVDQANLVFEVNEIEQARYRFVCANILDFDYRAAGPFDLVLCLGVLYHLSKPIELFEVLAPVNTDMLVIETKLSQRPGSLLEFGRDRLDNLKDAVDYELVMIPTAQAVIRMAALFGYKAGILAYPEDGAMGKYRYGIMRAFVCSKTDDPAVDAAFVLESPKELHAAQKRGLMVKKAKRQTA